MPSKNIKDVARAAGVSIATVSRALHGSGLVRPETLDRVMKVVRQSGYRPNSAARALAGGKSHLIAMIIPPGPDLFSEPYFLRLLEGVTGALGGREHRLMIYQPERYEPGLGYTSGIDELHADGVIVLCALQRDPLLRSLEVSRKPAVLVLARSAKLDWVDLDNVQAASQAVAYLAGLGHKRIAHISGPYAKGNSLDRIKGYRQALQAAGLREDPALLVTGDFKGPSGRQAVEKLLSLGNKARPTAIFAANDPMAFGAVRALQDAGLRIPQDMSVAGFDDVETESLSGPFLTTVRQPFARMGREACDLLLARMAAPRLPPVAREFTGELVVRASCGAPKS